MTLKELRIKHGLYQKQLASLLHIGRSAISKWENGIHIPSRETALRLAEIFDVSFETIERMFIKGGGNES